MEIFDFIYNTKTMQTACCLCFNTSENTVKLDEVIEIFDERSIRMITLRNIIKDTFLSFDILLNQACENCTSLILKIYLLIEKATIKIETMKIVTDRIDKQIASNKVVNQIYINLQEHCEKRVSKNRSETDSIIYEKPLLKNLDQLDLKKHDTGKSLVCAKCGKTCKNPTTLKSHLDSHRTVECPYCFKILKKNSHYNIHIKNHLSTAKKSTKVYNCDDCGHTTRNKTDLSSHMYKKHLNIRPYTCKICPKRFYSKRNLNEHTQIHENVKRNTCEMCGDQFSCKSALNNHLKLHVGHRSFTCVICNHNFVTASRRNEHVKRKHGEKLFSCTMCEKKYCLKKALNRHIKTTHLVTDESQIEIGANSLNVN